MHAAEQALAAGEPEDARACLDRAIAEGVREADIPRLALALAETNRYLGRHEDSLDWIDRRLAQAPSPKTRAVLLRARITSLRGIDTQAILKQADEALAAALAANDMESYAAVLMAAAFAGYRKGDAPAAQKFARLAAQTSFSTLPSQIHAIRAQMFAETVTGHPERAIAFSMEALAKQLELGDYGAAANEGNNVAEQLVELGRAVEAQEQAEQAADLALRAGHRLVAKYARVLHASAIAEQGRCDEGILLLRDAGVNHSTHALSADSAVTFAFWLVDRNNLGDAEEAAEVLTVAIQRAENAGVEHLLTALLAMWARALYRQGKNDEARAALARARRAAEKADSTAEKHLALAILELLPVEDPARRLVNTQMRARILRNAGHREDPHAYCTKFCLHRRILEKSGGIPEDLPRRAG